MQSRKQDGRREGKEGRKEELEEEGEGEEGRAGEERDASKQWRNVNSLR